MLQDPLGLMATNIKANFVLQVFFFINTFYYRHKINFFFAFLISLGIKKACDDLIDSYVAYGVDKLLMRNINKQTKRSVETISKEKDNLEIEILKMKMKR